MHTKRFLGVSPLPVGFATALLTASAAFAGNDTRGGFASATSNPSAFNVDTDADTPDDNIGDGVCADADGACSLRAAVQEANAAGGGTIRLERDAVYVLTIGGAGEDAAATGDLDVTGDITLRGGNATVDAAGLDRAFDILAGATLSVRDLTVRNGTVLASNGGGFRSAGTLSLRRATVFDCVADGAGASGGAISNEGGHLTVRGSELFGNSATRAGGAVEAVAGETWIDESEMSDNMTGASPGNGGALHLTGAGMVDVRRTLVRDNTAAREGGGLWNSSTGVMNVIRCEIVGNSATGSAADDGGGGLFNDGGTMEVIDSHVNGNFATTGSGSGGGVFNNGGELLIRRTKIEDNISNRAGGGIEVVAGTTQIDLSRLADNMTGASPGNGGGLHLTGAGLITVTRTEVTDNNATAEGGGLWNSAVGTMNIDGCTIRGNTAGGNDADQGGGGLFNDGGTMTVDDSIIRLNDAPGTAGSGGGILNNQGELIVTDSLVSRNSSSRAGGGIEANVGETTLDGVLLLLNQTGSSPGNGGGLHLTGAGTVDVDDSLVFLNFASSEGGGLWNSATGTMTVTDSAIFVNSAPTGADVFNDGGDFTIDGDPVPAG